LTVIVERPRRLLKLVPGRRAALFLLQVLVSGWAAPAFSGNSPYPSVAERASTLTARARALRAAQIAKKDRRHEPPIAERKPVRVERHGVILTDDYAWLRTKKLDEVLRRPEALEKPIRAHLDAELRYARAMLAPNAVLERELFAEMRGRTSVREETVPEAWGPWEYYTRYERGAQRKLHCRRPRGGGPEEILLDENKLARGRRAFSVSAVEVSPDHALLAYSVDEDGSERNVVRIRDLGTGRDLTDAIPEVRDNIVWSLDGQWLFYVRRHETRWARGVYRHKLGTSAAKDELVYEEAEEGFAVSLSQTLSDRFLVIEVGDFSTTELKIVDLADPKSAPRSVTERKRGHKYSLAHWGDRLIIATNADGAVDWKIGDKPVSAPAEESLREIVPHRAGRLIESFVAYRDHLVWLERDRERMNRQIVIRRWSDGAEHRLDFGEEPAKIDILPGLEQDTSILRFTYESMTQPQQVFDYDMETRQRTLRKVQDVPSGHDPARYITLRLEAPGQDGISIPVTLLYRRDTALDGSAPVWLYGYGAYGDTLHPEFSPSRLSLVDRGFVWALAHVRGGGEKGEAWHDAGRLANKSNTFADFISVAEHLIRLGITTAGRIVAAGESAGGTLIAAVANMRPELFGAIYTDAPFVDVLNTMLDRSLPLTETSFSEFGNPDENQADFEAMRRYSPYDNVRRQAYPPMLVLQSINDTRVPYWEAAKWVAKLRQLKTNTSPIIFYVKKRGGHSGGSGRFHALEDAARAFAFALTVLGDRAKAKEQGP
jgi:oligopeptidase B